MARYKTDLKDIHFNLFELLKVQDNSTDFELSDMKDIIEQFDKFVENEVFPVRTPGDREGVRLVNGQVYVPKCFHQANQRFYENGWYGLGIPEELGGIPVLDSITTACSSILIGANVSFSMYFGLSKAAMNVLLKVASDELKAKYIPKMMEGKWGGTMCLTEPGAGSDVGVLKTVAKKNSDGSYQINGTKIFISSGDNDLYENIVHLVLARIPGAPEGTKGISLFLVPKMKSDGVGNLTGPNDVVCKKLEDKMGIHAQATCELMFGENSNCQGFLIGVENRGMEAMFIMMNEARLMCGVQGESQANLSYMLTEQYAKERVQFGTEIINHPDIRRLLLRMRAMSRGLRALHLYTANLFDLEKLGKEWAEAEAALLTPICKSYGSENGFHVAVDAVQVHGGYGYCVEYGIEQFVRDIKIATIYEGTNGIQGIDFVTRKILKDQGKALMAIGGKIENVITSPEAANWKMEASLIGKSLADAGRILKLFGELASKKKINDILERSSDYLLLCGNLITAWLLMKSAIASLEKADKTTGDEKLYYQSKITDFRVFVQHYLVHNESIAKALLDFDFSYSDVEI